jgi:hypothetical protein
LTKYIKYAIINIIKTKEKNMRENYIISRNLKTENISSNTFSYSETPKKIEINPYPNFFHTIAYSFQAYYAYQYIWYKAFINLIRSNGKLKFRFAIHTQYNGRTKSFYEDCEVDIKSRRIKLRGFFATPAGMEQLKRTVEYVIENNKKENLKITSDEINEFQMILDVLEKEIEKVSKAASKIFQEAKYDRLGIFTEEDERVEKIITYFNEENVIWKPKFKTFEDIIQFLHLKKDKIKYSIIHLKKLDFNDSLIKEIFKTNEIHIYIKDFPDDAITETEIHISSKEDKYVNEDVKVTSTATIDNKKITVISNFFKNYDKVLYQKTIEKATENSEKILKNILKILNG